jgi:hypothetical protein
VAVLLLAPALVKDVSISTTPSTPRSTSLFRKAHGQLSGVQLRRTRCHSLHELVEHDLKGRQHCNIKAMRVDPTS